MKFKYGVQRVSIFADKERQIFLNGSSLFVFCCEVRHEAVIVSIKIPNANIQQPINFHGSACLMPTVYVTSLIQGQTFSQNIISIVNLLIY